MAEERNLQNGDEGKEHKGGGKMSNVQSIEHLLTTKISEVGCGIAHSAVVTNQGEVYTWGAGGYYQLGHGSSQDCRTPKKVAAFAGINILRVSCGSYHTIALSDSNDVFSWGLGKNGRLGHNNAQSLKRPAKITALMRKRIRRIVCGSDHSICISELGVVYTWGLGSFGNLGHGKNRDESEPTVIEALQGHPVTQVSAGAKHTIALTSNKEVFAFGFGGGGRLGFGDTVGTFTPKCIQALKNKDVVQVGCGESHSVCLTSRGEVYAWGMGDYGKLGNGDTNDMLNPVMINSTKGIKMIQIDCGAFHTMACTELGHLYSWGGGSYGKLGHGDQTNSLTPKLIEHVRNKAFCVISAGAFHSIAVSDEGWCYSWGYNGNGRLGHGDEVKNLAVPVQIGALADEVVSNLPSPELQAWRKARIGANKSPIDGLGPIVAAALVKKKIIAISCGSFHSLCLLANNDMYAWGANDKGQLGVGDFKDKEKPTQLKLLHGLGVVKIAAGSNHSLALTSNGHVYAWGKNDEGQLGNKVSERNEWCSPKKVIGMRGIVVVDIAAGESHSAAVGVHGEYFTWGLGSSGQLGHPECQDLAVPQKVRPLERVLMQQTQCGVAHTVAIMNTGNVYSWGSGLYGRLGHGDQKNRIVPYFLSGLQGLRVKKVMAGSFHTVAVTESGEFFAWGRNDYGQLGHGHMKDVMIPTFVKELQGYILVEGSCGDSHTVAVSEEGIAFSFGSGEHGKLGHGDTKNYTIPKEVSKMRGRKVTAAACGLSHTLLLTHDGDLYSMGFGSKGRLGHNDTETRMEPTLITSVSQSGAVEALLRRQGQSGVSELIDGDILREYKKTEKDSALSADDVQNLQNNKTKGNLNDLVILSQNEQQAMNIDLDGQRSVVNKLRGALQLEVFQLEYNEKEMQRKEDRIRNVVEFDYTAQSNVAVKISGLLRPEGGVNKLKNRVLYDKLFGYLILEPKPFYDMIISAEVYDRSKLDKSVKLDLIRIINDSIYSIKHRETEALLRLIDRVLVKEFQDCNVLQAAMKPPYITKDLLRAFAKRKDNVEAIQRIVQRPMNDFVNELRGQRNEGEDVSLDVRPDMILNQLLAHMGKHGREDLKSFAAQLSPEEAMENPEVAAMYEERQRKVTAAAAQFVDTIFTSTAVERLPFGLRWLSKEILNEARTKYPNATSDELYASVGSFIWEEVFQPAFDKPNEPPFNILEDRPSATMRENLRQVNDLLRNFCLMLRYANSLKWMVPFNVFLERNKHKYVNFIENLTKLPKSLDQHYDLLKRMEVYEADIIMPVSDIMTIHMALMNHKYLEAKRVASIGADAHLVMLKGLGVPDADEIERYRKEDVVVHLRPGKMALSEYYNPEFLKEYMKNGERLENHTMTDREVKELLKPFEERYHGGITIADDKFDAGMGKEVTAYMQVTARSLSQMKCPSCAAPVPPSVVIGDALTQELLENDEAAEEESLQAQVIDEQLRILEECRVKLYDLVRLVPHSKGLARSDGVKLMEFLKMVKAENEEESSTRNYQALEYTDYLLINLPILAKSRLIQKTRDEEDPYAGFVRDTVRVMRERQADKVAMIADMRREMDDLRNALRTTRDTKRELADRLDKYDQFLRQAESRSLDPQMHQPTTRTRWEKMQDSKTMRRRIQKSRFEEEAQREESDSDQEEKDKMKQLHALSNQQKEEKKKKEEEAVMTASADDKAPKIRSSVFTTIGQPPVLSASDMMRGTWRPEVKELFLGPFARLSHAKLEKFGVISYSKVPRNVRRKVKFYFLSHTAGKYEMFANLKRQCILRKSIEIADLLEMEQKGIKTLDLDIIEINANILTHFLVFVYDNKTVMRQKFVMEKRTLPESFQTPLYAVHSDIKIMVEGLCCPMMVVMNKAALENRKVTASDYCCTHPCYEYYNRRSLRIKYQIDAPEWKDFVAAGLCWCFAICQDAREIKLRKAMSEAMDDDENIGLLLHGGDDNSESEEEKVDHVDAFADKLAKKKQKQENKKKKPAAATGEGGVTTV